MDAFYPAILRRVSDGSGRLGDPHRSAVESAVKTENGYQDSLFTSPTVARNVAAPLVKYNDKVLKLPIALAPKDRAVKA